MVSLKERLELSSLSKREDKVRAKIKSLKRRIADAESYYGSLVELAEKNPYSREDRLAEAKKNKKSSFPYKLKTEIRPAPEWNTSSSSISFVKK